MNNRLQEKLKSLPISSGVYLHKSLGGEVIYVGKAAVLRNRVRQYFQNSRDFDVKTQALIAEIDDTDWIETESEIDALFLESELVKRYKPRYNVLLRDDKSQIYVRIDMKSEWPHLEFTRHPLDDGANYYGPYFNAFALKKALRYLRRVFPYYIKKPTDRKRDLDAHLHLSPAYETTSADYKKSLRQLIRYLGGERQKLLIDIEKNMKKAADKKDFETAARLRDQIVHLKELQNKIMFGDKEFLNISKDQALSDLSELLGLAKAPARIEGYDISHMSGSNVVASMVVFINGVSARNEYRKFKTSLERNNDFANMNEVIARRFSAKNLKSWGKPDLVLIDGGKGQLGAAIDALETLQINVPIVGLAKREEQIVIDSSRSNVNLNLMYLSDLKGYANFSDKFALVNLDNNTHIVKLLQRIRDESHRFAVSYHSTLKTKRQSQSILDDIQGVGSKTRSKLMRHFGSVKSIQSADVSEIATVVGQSKAKLIKAQLDKERML